MRTKCTLACFFLLLIPGSCGRKTPEEQEPQAVAILAVNHEDLALTLRAGETLNKTIQPGDQVKFYIEKGKYALGLGSLTEEGEPVRGTVETLGLLEVTGPEKWNFRLVRTLAVEGGALMWERSIEPYDTD